MRPRQWIKNIFVLAPLVFDHKLFNSYYVSRALVGFALFCLVSGVIYILNDVKDKEEDALHPRKRLRPIASGELDNHTAVVYFCAPVLIGQMVAGLIWGGGFSLVVHAYLVLQIAYILYLKPIPVVDVIAIAIGFVLRVVAGMVLVDAENFSLWLILCVFFLALFLGSGKRYAETLNGEGRSTRDKNYDSHEFVGQLLGISATLAIAMYATYTATATNLPSNQLAVATVAFVAYGVFRYLYVVHVKKIALAPDEALLKDRALQVDILLWGAAMLGVIYL